MEYEIIYKVVGNKVMWSKNGGKKWLVQETLSDEAEATEKLNELLNR